MYRLFDADSVTILGLAHTYLRDAAALLLVFACAFALARREGIVRRKHEHTRDAAIAPSYAYARKAVRR